MGVKSNVSSASVDAEVNSEASERGSVDATNSTTADLISASSRRDVLTFRRTPKPVRSRGGEGGGEGREGGSVVGVGRGGVLKVLRPRKGRRQ